MSSAYVMSIAHRFGQSVAFTCVVLGTRLPNFFHLPENVDIMKFRFFVFLTALTLCLCGSRTSRAQGQAVALPAAARAQSGVIVGTVVDVNDDTVPGATVILQGPTLESPRRVASNNNGFFAFNDLEAATPYHVTISAPGFANWTSPEVTLQPGQYLILRVNKLRIAEAVTKVTVGYSAEELATEQVKIEEQQRVFGIIPNFYVSYDPNAAPLTTKLKFKLAAKVAFDPVTFFGVGLVAASEQAGDNPDYRQGTIGYAERYGAAYTNGFTDIMIGVPSCHRFCTRTRATSTRARAQIDLALSTQLPAHSFARETTDGGRRTTRL
jgi:hypothetical protein